MTETDENADKPKASRGKRALGRFTCYLLLGYVSLVGCASIFENKFIYFPTRYPDGNWSAVDMKGSGALRLEDVWLTTSDSVKVHGWYAQPPLADVDAASADGRRPVVLFFHGNAGNLSHRLDILQMLAGMGVDTFIIDYRGYGRSEGEMSEQGLYHDAAAAWQYLIQQRNVPTNRIVIFGKSLGTAVASELATQVKPAGLLLESPFASVPEMASQVLPIMPKFLIRTRMDTINKVGEIACPKLVTHSRTDEIIPFDHGQRVFDAAGEPKQFFEVVGAGHNDMMYVGGEPYRRAVRQFIVDCIENDGRQSGRKPL